MLASAVFAVAFALVTVLTLITVGSSLLRTLDSTATRTGQEVARLVDTNRMPNPLFAGGGGVSYVQVVDAQDRVIDFSSGADPVVPFLRPDELTRARAGHRLTVQADRIRSDVAQRVVAVPASEGRTVLVSTDLSRVQDSVSVTRRAALFLVPVVLILMALLIYWVVGLALRAVGALRSGAARITAAGLSEQRLPVPLAHDEVHRLAVTLNVMLDRIEASTTRQRNFVGDAAHELRSPIASLRTQLEVASRLGPEVDSRELATDALVDVDRIARLVEDLLALARLDESGGQLRRRLPVNLDAIVEQTAAQYADARVPVTVRVAPARVSGDPEALRRVVVNLVDNAVRYTATTVTVTVRATDTDGEVTVADNGPGIPAEARAAVFDRFVRLDTARARDTGGTGLGLAIVRDVVRAHGGSVVLEDNEPGLRAVVVLPRA